VFSSAIRSLAALALVGAVPAGALADRVTIFAAASMTNAMAEIEDRFETATGRDLVVSLAGSSALARQIQHGAPADLFISADPGWMNRLAADGLIDTVFHGDVDFFFNGVIAANQQ